MPISSENGKQYIQEFIGQIKHDRMLDIGVGCGTYAKLFPGSDWTGVEAWEPYVDQFDLNSLYHNLILADARSVDYGSLGLFDVAFLGDVLEHMSSHDAAKLLSNIRDIADFVVISIPLGHHPQGAVNGNEFERHVEDWDHDKVLRLFGAPKSSRIEGEIGVYIYEKSVCKVPKTIHVVWVGNEENRPNGYIQTWKDMNPGWDIKIWGNDEYNNTEWVNKDCMQLMWDAGSLHGVADLMRYEILFREGGFCVDADSECIRLLDDELFDEKIVLTYENTETRSGLISVGYMAAVPGLQFFLDIIEDIKSTPLDQILVDHAWYSVGPRRLTDNYDRIKPENSKILPDYTFIPEHFDAPAYVGDGAVYAKQHWQTTNKNKKKLKICVYSISKNEEKFVKRWSDSAKDADLILLADTGSTDRTIEVAEECGVQVHQICITPWRFDHARNASIALIPKDMDICVCIDVDEVLEPGWREEIERVWTDKTTRLRYMFDWGSGIKFQYEKIHARHGYYWHHPCHEYPRPDARITEQYAYTSKLLVSHHPDPTKSRGQYLDLLKLSVTEDPFCPRNAFYYARELSFHCRWEEAIEECKRYLALPSATWHNERCYAYRVMGKSYESLDKQPDAEKAYQMACSEAPMTREPWCELAMLMYKLRRWEECFAYSMRALKIVHREQVYTCDPAVWGHWAHDLAAVSAWEMGIKDIAREQAKLAYELSPNDQRLKSNLEFMQGLASD